MCKEIKRLTELSQCIHLNKTDRDAVTWAIYQIQPTEVEPDKGFDGYDFSSWPLIPDKKLFKEVEESRIKKNKVIMTQAWVLAVGPHLHFLKEKGVTVETALRYIAKNGWQGFGAKWVLDAIEKDKENMPTDDISTKSNMSEQDYINDIMAGKITHISQIKGYKNLMTSNYASGLYNPPILEALTKIGFAV